MKGPFCYSLCEEDDSGYKPVQGVLLDGNDSTVLLFEVQREYQNDVEGCLDFIVTCLDFCHGVPAHQLSALDAVVGLDELLIERTKLRKALAELQANPNDPRAHRVAMDALNYLKGVEV